MKSVLETSVYLIIMVLIGVVSVSLIKVNRVISKVDETAQYIRDYTEIYGSCDNNANMLDEKTVQELNKKAQENGMKFEYSYEARANGYVYWNATLAYKLSVSVFNIRKDHTYRLIMKSREVGLGK